MFPIKGLPTLLCLITITILFAAITPYTNADYKLADYGLGEIQGTLAAIGDFDSDKQTDLFIVSYDSDAALYRVDLYEWTTDERDRYQKRALGNEITSVDPIHSVILGDFNYDGRLDVLITGPKQTTPAPHILADSVNNNGTMAAQQTPVVAVAEGEYYVKIFFGDAREIISTSPFVLDPSPIGQVSSMSLSGSLLPDLFGMYFDRTEGAYHRAMWSFAPLGNRGSVPTDPTTSFSVTFHALPTVTSDTNPLLNSASFPYLATGFAPILGDFNGDCAADLVLVTTSLRPDQQLHYPSNDLNGDKIPYDPTILQYDPEKQIEIWIFDRSAPNTSVFPYTLHSTLPAQIGILQPAIGDFNKDGALDLAIPYCYPYSTCGAKNSIEMHFNTQRGMCSSLSLSSSCRSATSLCVSDPDWTLDYVNKQTASPAPQSNRISVLDDDDTGEDQGDDDDEAGAQPSYYAGYKIVTTTAESFSANNIVFALPHLGLPLSLVNPPFRLTVVDVNLDSELDFLFNARKVSTTPEPSPTQSSFTSYTAAITTFECTKQRCGDKKTEDKLYGFVSLPLPNLESVTRTYLNFNHGTIDFGNSGSVDLLILRFPPTVDVLTVPYHDLLNAAQIAGLANNFHDDVYFLTLLGGNGMCHSWCNGLEFPSPKPYGVSQSGLVFKFTVTSLGGSKSPRIFVQLPQTAYSPISAPYQVIGLGRTSNYIEELFLGIPTTQAFAGADNAQLFQAMIPNSQIVVFPYPISNPLSWRLELFISPTQRLLAVFIAFLVTTVACCGVILVLHLREKFEEEKLKKQRQRLFAF